MSLDLDEHGHGVPKPAMYIPNNINVRELYPILEAIWRWGPDWRDRRVVCYSDNTQVVAAINTGRSANGVAMDLLRKLFWQSVLCNCHLVSLHLSGSENVVADALSRVTTGAVIPVNLCCRGGNLPTASGPTSGGNTVVGLVGIDLEDKTEPVEEVCPFLRATDVTAGAN